MMKVSELAGSQLDWAVAKAMGLTPMFCLEDGKPICCVEEEDFDGCEEWVEDGLAFTPSVYWNQGGPIIDRERIATSWDDIKERWYAEVEHGALANGVQRSYGIGPTPLIAAMRAYVASKFGEEIGVPT